MNGTSQQVIDRSRQAGSFEAQFDKALEATNAEYEQRMAALERPKFIDATSTESLPQLDPALIDDATKSSEKAWETNPSGFWGSEFVSTAKEAKAPSLSEDIESAMADQRQNLARASMRASQVDAPAPVQQARDELQAGVRRAWLRSAGRQ